MHVAQLAETAIQHLHTARTVLHGGRRVRLRWTADAQGTRVELARIHMSLRAKDGRVLPEFLPITGIPTTPSAHAAIAAHQTRDALLAAMDALGQAWAAHPVLGPMMDHTHKAGQRQLGLVLSTSGRHHTLHLELGAATWTIDHTASVETTDLLAAIAEVEALPVERSDRRLMLASAEPALCHACALGQANAWGILLPFTCPASHPQVWRTEATIGLEDTPYAPHAGNAALQQAWTTLCEAQTNVEEPVYDAVVAVWDGARICLGASLETARYDTGRPMGILHSARAYQAMEAAQAFLAALVAEVPAAAGSPHAPRPWVELAVRRTGPGFQWPVFGAFGRVHHSVDDCVALAGVAGGGATWMAVRGRDPHPRAVFSAPTPHDARIVADRLRETDAVDLYRRVDTPTS